MCALCGVFVRWHPGSFVDDMPCCLRCDPSLLPLSLFLLPPPATRLFCRYCGKPSDATSGAAHRVYKAPLDIAGPNATLPSPLRRVCFCATHQRAWLSAALRQLPSSVVLVHIAHGVRPVLNTGEAANKQMPTAVGGETVEVGDQKPRKRVKTLRKRPRASVAR